MLATGVVDDRFLLASWATHRSKPAGEMAEWLKAHAWKACLLERVTWVRIPLSPPVLLPSFPSVFTMACRVLTPSYH
jgi:hypothetical protein